jgi:DNA primase catalytic core
MKVLYTLTKVVTHTTSGSSRRFKIVSVSLLMMFASFPSTSHEASHAVGTSGHGLQAVPFEVALERVKSSLNLLEVVGRKVALKKHGRNYLGLCPFHQEKTPSFNVSETKGMFKCFGCGAGGDALKFLMETEQLSFPELIEQEAKALGLVIVRDAQASREAKARRTEEDRLLELLQTIQHYYQQWLLTPATGQETQRYLQQERLFPEAIWRRFGLGLALQAWENLYPTLEKHLKTQVTNATEYQAQKTHLFEDLQHLGFLVSRPDNKGHYDRFRHRLMIPIHNAKGQVVAFGGRVLHAQDTPKYMNSPEHILYQKSDTLYALHLAKKAIHETQEACIVEGYFDVMRLHQFGWHHTVATCGTAFTEGHLRILQQQGVKRIYLAFDSDKAGQKATLSALSLLAETSIDVWVLQYPEKDADAWLAPYQDHPTQAQSMLAQWKTQALSPTMFRCQQALKHFLHEQLNHPPDDTSERLNAWLSGTWQPVLSMSNVMTLGRLLIPLMASCSPIESALLAKQYAPLLGVTPEVFQQELSLYRQHAKVQGASEERGGLERTHTTKATSKNASHSPQSDMSRRTSHSRQGASSQYSNQYSKSYSETTPDADGYSEDYSESYSNTKVHLSDSGFGGSAYAYEPALRHTMRQSKDTNTQPMMAYPTKARPYAKKPLKGTQFKSPSKKGGLKSDQLIMQDETPMAPPIHDALSRETERYKTLEVYLFLLWWVVSGQARLAVWQVVQETIWPQLDPDSTLYKLWHLLNQWFESAMLQQEHLTQQDCLDILVPLLKDKPALQRQTLHLLQQIPKLTSSLPWIDPLREPHGQDPALLNRFYHILMEWQLEWKRLQVRHVLREKNKELYQLEQHTNSVQKPHPLPVHDDEAYALPHTLPMVETLYQGDIPLYDVPNDAPNASPASIHTEAPAVTLHPTFTSPSLASNNPHLSLTQEHPPHQETPHQETMVSSSNLKTKPAPAQSQAHIALHQDFRQTLKASDSYRLKSSQGFGSALGRPLTLPVSSASGMSPSGIVTQALPVPATTLAEHQHIPHDPNTVMDSIPSASTHITQHLYIANQMLVQHHEASVPVIYTPVQPVTPSETPETSPTSSVSPPPLLSSQEPDAMLTIPPEPPCNWILDETPPKGSLPSPSIPSPYVPSSQMPSTQVPSTQVPYHAGLFPSQPSHQDTEDTLVNPFSDIPMPATFNPEALRFS